MAVHLNAPDKQVHTVVLNLRLCYQAALSWNAQPLYLGGFKQTEYHIVALLERGSPVHHHFERVAHRGDSRACERMEVHIACFRAILLDEILIAHRLIKRRSEEHTSELQSRQYLVCRLLLEKKKKSYSLSVFSSLI